VYGHESVILRREKDSGATTESTQEAMSELGT
jgi:hypothetical protein